MTLAEIPTNIVRVGISLPPRAVVVVWRNLSGVTIVSTLVLLMAAAVLQCVRGKIGDHAQQLRTSRVSANLRHHLRQMTGVGVILHPMVGETVALVLTVMRVPQVLAHTLQENAFVLLREDAPGIQEHVCISPRLAIQAALLSVVKGMAVEVFAPIKMMEILVLLRSISLVTVVK